MRKYSATKRGWAACLSVIVTCALAAGMTWAAEDPYLAGLQDEAQKLDSLGQAKKEQEMLETAAAPAPKAQAAVMPSAKQLEFETELEHYPAGFGLYTKLSGKDKDAVFQEYLKAAPNRRYAAAIRKTIELSVRKQH